ncbi:MULTISPECIES: class I SAM-dependent methyltransferase [Methylosinus]|uniref:class I SAM-dependent methyltransferase n=1 Tax=Methylosinus TaxID=425 RepID=UPI0001D2EF18|nr:MULTISPECIES: class I SAM-dependent methyltransferase [Methylosinus]
MTDAKVAATRKFIIETAERLGVEFKARFEALKAAGDPEHLSPSLGFAGGGRTLGPDGGLNPVAPAKYFFDSPRLVDRFIDLLPYFEGPSTTFDIGVGPGTLLVLLREIYGQKVCGIDVELEQRGPYKALRQAYGLTDVVFEHWVRPFQGLPIPPGTEQVVVFSPAFHSEWKVPEYEFFIEDCRAKMTGPKRLILFFNLKGFTAEGRRYFAVAARRPRPEYKNFFIMEL